MRFLHMADVHLGYPQYNNEERFRDFRRAFEGAVTLAIDRAVDVCIVAGDLFHKASIDSLTLYHAERGLQRLQDAGITTLAVHGNHDRVRYRDRTSWLDYLARRELLTLLEVTHNDDGDLAFEPDRAYVDLDGVRFVGVQWLGASAPAMLQQVAAKLAALPPAGIHYTVLITHAGLEGQIPDMGGGLRFSDLAPLKPYVNYLALGHIHKPYAEDGWIYNPSSLEACSFKEAAEKRGVYVVEVGDGSASIEHIETPARPFYTVIIRTDHAHDPAALRAAIEAELDNLAAKRKHSGDRLPVVRLLLRGNLPFDRAELNMEELRRLVEDRVEALVTRIVNQTTPAGFETAIDEDFSREALERLVLEDLFRADARYSDQATTWGGAAQQIKAMALSGEAPEDIYRVLNQWMEQLAP